MNMKQEIINYYRRMRRAGFTVGTARAETADKFGVSVIFVAALVIGVY